MSSTKGCKYTGGMFLREQSGDSHQEGHQWPQNTHIPRRLACRTCVASASSLNRMSSPLSCATPPAPLARAGSARCTCSPRAARAVHRAPSAACYRAGSWGVLECSAFEPTIVLFSAEFGLDVHGRHKKFEEYTKKYKQPLLEP